MDSPVEGHVVGEESLKEANGVTSKKGRLMLDELLEAEVAIIHY